MKRFPWKWFVWWWVIGAVMVFAGYNSLLLGWDSPLPVWAILIVVLSLPAFGPFALINVFFDDVLGLTSQESLVFPTVITFIVWTMAGLGVRRLAGLIARRYKKQQ